MLRNMSFAFQNEVQERLAHHRMVQDRIVIQKTMQHFLGVDGIKYLATTPYTHCKRLELLNPCLCFQDFRTGLSMQ